MSCGKLHSVPTIALAAAIITDPSGQFLVVRKHGSEYFMQAGGKIDPGETPLTAVIREVREELGVTYDPTQATLLGSFTDDAVNEPGHTISAEIFTISNVDPALIQAQAEIAEIRWIDPVHPDQALRYAPLTQQLIRITTQQH